MAFILTLKKDAPYRTARAIDGSSSRRRNSTVNLLPIKFMIVHRELTFYVILLLKKKLWPVSFKRYNVSAFTCWFVSLKQICVKAHISPTESNKGWSINSVVNCLGILDPLPFRGHFYEIRHMYINTVLW